MGEAFFWGFVGAVSLLIGAVVAIALPPSRRTLGLIMGFGAGVLISALSSSWSERRWSSRTGWPGSRSGC